MQYFIIHVSCYSCLRAQLLRVISSFGVWRLLDFYSWMKAKETLLISKHILLVCLSGHLLQSKEKWYYRLTSLIQSGLKVGIPYPYIQISAFGLQNCKTSVLKEGMLVQVWNFFAICTLQYFSTWQNFWHVILLCVPFEN